MDVSIVIPFYNEERSINRLYSEIKAVFSETRQTYEIIFVDDGSTDAGFKVAQQLFETDQSVAVIQFRRNFGKAAALSAGVHASSGEVVITMDADLQDVPGEIPRFLDAMGSGYDVVSGWKQYRNDPLAKTAPSKLFNWVTQKCSRLNINDFNCGFKAYRREVFDHIQLYGELHRYIPVLAHWKGFRVGEISVEHRPRRYGQSKYGLERMLKGLFDLLTILVTQKYGRRPLHLFGLFGFSFCAVGLASLMYLAGLWVLDAGPIGTRPLLFFGMLAILFGGQLISFGLLAELLAKLDMKGANEYVVKKKLSRPEQD